MKRIAFILLAGAVTLFTGVQAQPPKAVTAKPTIIFVHGLWADGSSWNKVTTQLLSDGYKVIAVQNPTTSLEDDVAATKRAIERAGGDVILVGHSWGGFVISEAGDDPHVKALVYVAAFAPAKGETIATLSANAAPTQLQSYLQSVGGVLTLSREGVRKAFAGDLPEKEQDLVYSVQQPASPTVFGAVSSVAAWNVKKSWFIVASEDGAIHPDLERFMAKRIGAKTTVLKTSHVPMVSKPQEVLNVILDAARNSDK